MVELLSVEEVAKLFHLHEMTVRRYIKHGDLKAVRVGGRIRVRREEVDHFMRPLKQENYVSIAEPPSSEEIARRRELFDQVMRLRQKIGPIGITAGELVRQARSEEQTADE